MTTDPQLVVFSDLDGSLLDHHTYAWDEAGPALDALARHGVPLVLVTSKTCAEVVPLRCRLGNHHPFIAENGAVTVVPPGYFGGSQEVPSAAVVGEDGLPRRSDVSAALDRARRLKGFVFRSFKEMGPEGIARCTGLDRDAAEAANDRIASEPLLWEDDEKRLAEFTEFMRGAGFRCIQGGRFLHVMGQIDKADAMAALVRSYGAAAPSPPVVVAIGDGPNDLAMLASADIAVVIKSVHGHPMALPNVRRMIRTSRPGPAGWCDAVLALLREFASPA